MHKCLFIADTNEPCTYDTTKEYCDYFGESRNNEHKECPFYGGKVLCSCGFPQSYPEPHTHSKCICGLLLDKDHNHIRKEEQMSHTKGKWRVKESGGCVVSPNKTVCQLTSIEDGALSITPEVEANARLISLAPELMFHIKDLIEQINQFPQTREGINVTYAQQIIDKVEG